MYSTGLPGRKYTIDDTYSSSQRVANRSRCTQMPTQTSSQRKSRQRDRRYARDVISQSVYEWLHGSPKLGKQKCNARRKSTSPLAKRNFVNRQTYSDLNSYSFPVGRATPTPKSKKKKLENFRESNSLTFPIHSTTDHSYVQKDSLNKDRSSLVDIPETICLASGFEDKQCSCQITMTFRSDTISSSSTNRSKRDEVSIYQQTHKYDNIIVYKGFLKAGDQFSFKTQRSINDRFELVLCINDLVDSHISSCCEYKYRNGCRIGGNDGVFWIQSIDGAKYCKKCRENVDETISFHPINQRSRSVGSSSRISQRVTLPSINADHSNSKKRSENVSNEKRAPSVDIHTSRSYTENKSRTLADEFRLTSGSNSPIATPIELTNRSASSLDLTLSNNIKINPSTKRPKPKHVSNGIVPLRASSPIEDSRKKSNEKGFIRNTKKKNFASKLSCLDRTIQSSNKRTKSIQPLSTFIQNGIMQYENETPRRLEGNVENFSLGWFGNHIEANDISLLRCAINFIRIFNNVDELNSFLTEPINSKIIILISYDRSQSIVNQIHKIKAIYSIYILSTNEIQGFSWVKSYSKITGIYPTLESVRDHLLVTLPRISSTLIPIIVNKRNKTDDLTFPYHQLLKETLLCNDEECDLKHDTLEYCRRHYENNSHEMNLIQEFENDSTGPKIFSWYTRNCFISKVLYRAYCTQEIDLLYKMRYIIQSLHIQFKSVAINEKVLVHTLINCSIDQIKEMQENINGLLMFGAYLPAMFQRSDYSNINHDRTDIFVNFSINLASNCAVNIKNKLSSNSDIDVLINIDTIFRIRSIEKQIDQYWNVTLESVNSTDSQMKNITDTLRTEITAPVVLLQLSKLLLATDRYKDCDNLANVLSTDQSLQNDPTLLASLAAVYHLLGNADDEREDITSARKQFFKSLTVFQTFLQDDHPLLSASYNNIGSMYFKDEKYDEAIRFHQKALDCQLNSPSPDTDAIATYSNNIGAVYFEQENYVEALKHLQRAVKILEKLSSDDKLPNLCAIYQKIAASYWRMDKAKEALGYYLKTLDIQLNSLPIVDHQISVTYFNLSTAYARVGQIDQAVITAEKSIEHLLKIYPNDHPEVKENQAQLEVVRQKQWLQQVLTT